MQEKESLHRNLLLSAGLEEGESLVYELLLDKGELKAGEIIKNTPLKRGNVYNILKTLLSKRLIEEFDINSISHYRPLHPSSIKSLYESKIKELEKKREAVEGVLPDLASLFNLNQYKPTIKYFEGEQGVSKALMESLNYKGEVYTYIDAESLNDWAETLNKKYVKERLAQKIKKKILYFDSSLARDFLSERQSLTDERIIVGSKRDLSKHSEATIQIFEEAILYLTFSESHKIAVLINDVRIARLHRRLFEATWQASANMEARQNQSPPERPLLEE